MSALGQTQVGTGCKAFHRKMPLPHRFLGTSEPRLSCRRMKPLLLLVLSLGAFLNQPALSGASEQGDEVHAAVVDIPDAIDMSYASPDTWQTMVPSKKFYENPPIPVPKPDEADLPTPTQQLTNLAALQ
jgi:hypothetical protein